MKRAIAIYAACCAIFFSCGSGNSDDADPGPTFYAFAAAGVFTNFCGTSTQYFAGANTVLIDAGVRHWIEFPYQSSQSYEIVVNEAIAQNVQISEILCLTGGTRSGGPSDPLSNSSATGQTETFRVSPSGVSGILILCSEGCSVPINFTIPSNPATPI